MERLENGPTGNLASGPRAKRGELLETGLYFPTRVGEIIGIRPRNNEHKGKILKHSNSTCLIYHIINTSFGSVLSIPGGF